MAPRFKVKVVNTSKLLKNITIISVVLLSFFLVLFSKRDYLKLNNIKNIYSTFIAPLTKIVSSPINAISNLVKEYNQFKSLKFENKLLQEEIIRLKKWQTLAIQKFKRK